MSKFPNHCKKGVKKMTKYMQQLREMQTQTDWNEVRRVGALCAEEGLFYPAQAFLSYGEAIDSSTSDSGEDADPNESLQKAQQMFENNKLKNKSMNQV